MIPARKVTPDDLPMLAFDGPARVQMHRECLAGISRKPSDTVRLRLLPRHGGAARRHGRKLWEGAGRARTFRPFCVNLFITLPAPNTLYPAPPA